MRRLLKYYIWILLFCPLGLIAQSVLEKRIAQFEAKGIGLEAALLKLSQVSGVNISYSPEIIPQQFLLNIKIADQSTLAILSKLISGTRIRYAIVDEQIVLYIRGGQQTQHLISGIITDALSGEALLSANVYSPELRKGSSSNNFGYYALYLPEGKHRIVISYLGYKSKEIEIDLYRNQQLHFRLSPSVTLDEVIIFNADSIDNGLIQQTTIQIADDAIRTNAGPGGEDDIARVLQRQAGVQTGADGIGGLNIRGGSDDQNLLLIDGTAVYYPSHVFGVFTLLNTSSLRQTKFSKNNLVVPMGKRLSSVVDVRTKVGHLSKYGGLFTINPSAVKAMIEGPIIPSKLSFLVSARRSLSLPFRIIPDRGPLRSEAQTNIDFNDANIRLYYQPNEKNRFVLQFFNGADNYSYVLDYQKQDKAIHLLEERKYHWSNTFGSFHWTSLLSPKLFLKSSINFSGFHYDAQNASQYEVKGAFNKNRYISLRSKINDAKLQADFDFYLSTRHFVQFGASGSRHVLAPQFLIGQDSLKSAESLTLSELELARFRQVNTSLTQWNLYLDDHITLSDYFRVQLGLYSTLLRAEDRSLVQLLPKLAIQYRHSPKLNISLFAQRSTQFFHKLDFDLVGYPNSLWIGFDKNTDPKINWSYSLALEGNFGRSFQWTAELYYSALRNFNYLTDEPTLRDIISNQLNVAIDETKKTLSVDSYGLEWSMSGQTQRVSYGANYTWSHSERTLDQNIFQSLNERPPYLREHNANAHLGLKLSKNWTAHLLSTMGSGTPAGYIYNRQDQLFTDRYRDDIRRYEAKHGAVLRPIIRHDFNMRFDINQEGRASHSITLGVYNITDRQNELYRIVDDNPDLGDKKIIYPVTGIGRRFFASYRLRI